MDIVAVYNELAEFEEQRGESQPRDRFLILAADAALAQGDNDRAEELRRRLLEFNPHHLLKPYPTFADSLKAPDVFGYVADLRHSYPPEEAQRLLASMRGGAETAEPEPFPKPAAQVEDEPEEPLIYPLSRREPPPPAPEKPAAAPPPRPAPSSRPPARLLVEPAPEPAQADDEVYPLPRRTKVRREEAPPPPVSDWVASFLFAILLIAALGLATYTLARPFFSP
jgi:hypothetical protein